MACTTSLSLRASREVAVLMPSAMLLLLLALLLSPLLPLLRSTAEPLCRFLESNQGKNAGG